MMTADILRENILRHSDETQVCVLQRFFRTGPGDYGEGDRFLGVRVPITRRVVREAFRENRDIAIDDLLPLLHDPYHEVRFAALLYLTMRYAYWEKRDMMESERTLRFYLEHAECGNNWDLVDCICPHLLGPWLCRKEVDEEEKFRTMDALASSSNLWRQRISMVATWMPLRHQRPDFTLRYAAYHLHHPHHLMHKAVGWMLREMGKQVDMGLLRSFLERHADTMPRTALRYAIERMEDGERQFWLKTTRNRQVTE